ncbi:hypothetical protein Cabys_1507 [Caldithrix abyssi DSM 13497]|uniref:Uncharacterized protein n=1 Tax=Caldithrix abyssi DSM 13497 TaxID=880073 RepID=A0A1J1C8L2_CALAY|nr:hypothetical protein Cabys_1507 [Caldithrix abyssi DSM 13497]
MPALNYQGSAAAIKINRNVRKVIFSQFMPIIAENYVAFKTKAKQIGTLLFVIRNS